MLRLVASAVTTGLVAIALGCGDDTSGEEPNEPAKPRVSVTTDHALTKAKFLAHVNELCRRKWRFIMNAVKQTRVLWEKQYPRVNDRQNYLRAVRLSFFSSLNFLIFDWVRRLGAPPGGKQAVEELLGAMQETIDQGSRGVRFTTVPQLQALFTRYNEEARRYGLDQCLVSGAHIPRPEV
jgi:hypothetical protein